MSINVFATALLLVTVSVSCVENLLGVQALCKQGLSSEYRDYLDEAQQHRLLLPSVMRLSFFWNLDHTGITF